VQVIPSELAAIAKLKNALTDFQGRPVHFIEEEYDRLVAGACVPVRRAERSYVTVSLRQTQKVAFGHLACAPLNDGHIHGVRELIDDTGFANAVPTPKQNRMVCVSNVGKDG
jgi:hypothetical protein